MISTTLAVRSNKVRAKVAETEEIEIATVAVATVAVTIMVMEAASAKEVVVNKILKVANAVTTNVTLGFETASDRGRSDDGLTIKVGGYTSWAALQPHRQGCYGGAIALWL